MDATTVATIAERGLRRGCPWPAAVPEPEDVNTAHAGQRGPGERANAQLKSWKVLRFCPARATELVNAVQVLILTG
jgi:hypothetical protein